MSDVIDEWQAALAPFSCDEQTELRACLIGSLAARLRHYGLDDLFRQSIEDALIFNPTRRRAVSGGPGPTEGQAE